jgi:hypothetical protein
MSWKISHGHTCHPEKRQGPARGKRQGKVTKGNERQTAEQGMAKGLTRQLKKRAKEGKWQTAMQD